MNKKDKEEFKKLIDELRTPQAMPYSSNPPYDDGVDSGREIAADEIEWLIQKLTKK